MPIDYSLYGKPVPYVDGWTEWQYITIGELLGRLIYAEAMSESYSGKQGVCSVVYNRLALDIDEFGHTIHEIILKPGSFAGSNNYYFSNPDVNSQAWKDSLYIGIIGTSNANPIGFTLWFNTNSVYNSRCENGNSWRYHFGSGLPYQDVVEKYVIGNHTFFRVAGTKYQNPFA